jgi:hypothetical protein
MTRRFVLLGLTAVLAHLIGMAADVYSGYAPSVKAELGSFFSLSFENIQPLLRAKSLEDARFGHYLAILFIPLGLCGIYQVYLGLSPRRNRLASAFLVPGVLGVVYATSYHGTLAFLTGALQTPFESADSTGMDVSYRLVTYFNSLSEPLGVVLIVADIVVVSAFVFNVLYRKTLFPIWMAAVNPLTLQMLLGLLMLVLPHPVDQFFWVTIFNGSLSLWYALTTWVLSRVAANE